MPDHPLYEVSSLGRVRSNRHKTSRILTPYYGGDGYLNIKLGRGFQTSIHRLVLSSFFAPPPGDVECRHLDGNPHNNRLDNLRWGTRSENYHDRHAHGTDNNGERHGNAKLTSAAVRGIRTSTLSDTELAGMYGVTRSTVNGARSGRSWRHESGAVKRPGTPRVGERNGRARLSESQVIEIRSSGLSDVDLAVRFGVCRQTVSMARTRQTWRHLP